MRKWHLFLAVYSLTAAAVRPAEPPQSVLDTPQSAVSASPVQNVLADALLQNTPAAFTPERTDAERYREAMAKALDSGQSIAVWAGYPCQPCQAAVKGVVHCNVTLPWNGVTVPTVVVGRNVYGGMTRYDVPVGDGTNVVDHVLQAVNPHRVASSAPQTSACGCTNCPAGGNCSYTGQCNQPQCFANGYTGMTCGPNGCASGNCGAPSFGGPFMGGGCASGNCGQSFGGPMMGGGCAGGNCGSGGGSCGAGGCGSGGGRRGFFGGFRGGRGGRGGCSGCGG